MDSVVLWSCLGCLVGIILGIGLQHFFLEKKDEKKTEPRDLFELGCRYMELSGLYQKQKDIILPLMKDAPEEKQKELCELITRACDLTKELIKGKASS